MWMGIRLDLVRYLPTNANVLIGKKRCLILAIHEDAWAMNILFINDLNRFWNVENIICT